MDPHVTDWLTKPSQVPWTGNQPICQVVYISVFCLHTLLRPSKVQLFFMGLNMSRCSKKGYSSWDLICPDVWKKVKWLQRSIYIKHFFKKWSTYILCAPFLLRGWVSYQIFKKGGLKGSKFLEGSYRKRGGYFFEQEEGGIAAFT